MSKERKWTPADEAELIRLWPTHSSKQIADQLNRTRQSAAGKAWRLIKAGRLLVGVVKHYKNMPWPERISVVTRKAKRKRKPAAAPITMAKPEPKLEAASDYFAILAVTAIMIDGISPNYPQLNPQPCTFADLQRWQCKWPIGDPASPEFRFCGDRRVAGRPYCPAHIVLAYHPNRDNRHDRTTHRQY